MRITTAMALRRSRTPRRNMIRFYLIPSSVIHPSEEGWGRQNVETDLVNIWTGVVRDAISVRTLRCILSNLVSTLSTPTPPEEGWGRQTVETVLVNIWTGVACDATRI